MSTPTVEQIHIILRKAEDPATTPEEAEMLTERAEKLMIKLGLDAAAVEAAATGEVRREPIIKHLIIVKGLFRQGDSEIATAVGFGLKIQVYTHTRRYWNRGKVCTEYGIWFVGFQSDVERALELYESLRLQGHSALRVWYADQERWLLGREKFHARRSYLFGFAQGVLRRMRDNRRKIEEEVENSNPGTAVAVRDRNAAVLDWVADEWGEIDKSKARGVQVMGRAMWDGHADGLNARTGETEVGARHQIGGGR